MASKSAAREPQKMHIKKGDKVRVLAGKDRGKEGDVISVSPKAGKVVVENINIAKKAVRPHPQKSPQGGIISVPQPLDASNVMLVCPRCSKPSRTTRHTDAEGRRSRKCKKCGELIDG
jgi:large subunit ribosomal protein L24